MTSANCRSSDPAGSWSAQVQSDPAPIVPLRLSQQQKLGSRRSISVRCATIETNRLRGYSSDEQQCRCASNKKFADKRTHISPSSRPRFDAGAEPPNSGTENNLARPGRFQPRRCGFLSPKSVRPGDLVSIASLESRSSLATGCVVRSLSNSEARSNELVCTGMQMFRFDD